jgi:hypothetical protein
MPVPVPVPPAQYRRRQSRRYGRRHRSRSYGRPPTATHAATTAAMRCCDGRRDSAGAERYCSKYRDHRFTHFNFLRCARRQPTSFTADGGGTRDRTDCVTAMRREDTAITTFRRRSAEKTAAEKRALNPPVRADAYRSHAPFELLSVSRVIRAAVSAVNHDTMNSVLLRVQQDRAAVSADIIHGLVYLLEDWRSI